MMTGKPSDLLEVLEQLQRQYPAWRFGQLVANVAGWADQDVWDVEDDVLLEAARSHLETAKKQTQEVCV
ncbi:MAG: hypothetical protein KJ000_27085 [Pirellulaceae bacterium]|nr:hypothetical protein [Pirellulaceae bacterium]